MEKNNQIPKLISVEPIEDFKLQLEYNDGVKGVVDLHHLKGKGLFKWWDEGDNFSKVYLDTSGAIVWNEDIDIDALNCYLKLTNKTFEEYASS